MLKWYTQFSKQQHNGFYLTLSVNNVTEWPDDKFFLNIRQPRPLFRLF